MRFTHTLCCQLSFLFSPSISFQSTQPILSLGQFLLFPLPLLPVLLWTMALLLVQRHSVGRFLRRVQRPPDSALISLTGQSAPEQQGCPETPR
jgi:hypothetical protein